MKIAIFSDDYLPYVHGVTTSIQNTRQALEALGHEVYVVAPRPKQKDFVENDDHVIRLPSVNSYIFDNRPVSLLYPGIARKLYDYDFDIVHSQTQFYLFVIAGMVARKCQIPHITTVHTIYTELLDDYPTAVTAGLIAVSIGYPFVFKTRPILPFSSAKEIRELPLAEAGHIRKKQGWRLIAACINQADQAIAPSKHLSETLIENGTTTPLHVMPNAIDIKRYRRSSIGRKNLVKKKGEKVIVSVARVSGEKRQEVLVRAMAMMKIAKVRLVLVGDGPELERLQNLADELGVGSKVTFTGLLGGQDVVKVLSEADVFTLASYRFDNQPMSILEAIASGLPVVYCDDNLTEGLERSNSLLTSGIEAEDFAAAFDSLLADKKRLSSMAKASLKIAKKFDRTASAKKLVKLYETTRTELSERS
jgi:1,2-diacylglycerol 3-alpha-glucosyltransferase